MKKVLYVSIIALLLNPVFQFAFASGAVPKWYGRMESRYSPSVDHSGKIYVDGRVCCT